MGLKRRNPARTRLLTAPEVLAVMAASAAPAANAEAKPAVVTKAADVPAPVVAAPRKITGDERHTMIAKAAYRHAELAGFASDPVQNWLAAEREIDAALERKAS